MICNSCGKLVKDGMPFCNYCGASMSKVNAPATGGFPGIPAYGQSLL